LGCLGLYDDANLQALGDRLARARRQAPPKPVALQLAHAGRKGSSQRPWEGGTLIPLSHDGWTPVAPSAIPHAQGEAPPAALDAAGLVRIRDAFVAAAKRAEAVGIDALELHCAHGYLLHEFLSPLSNRRDDGYGGSFERRIRFPLEVFDAVRAAWPEGRPLGARISATDWMDGGWTIDDSIEFARELKSRGCDWIDVSSAGISPLQKITATGPGVHVPFARAIRHATGITTMAVGLITDPKHANAIVANGDADMVALARAFLRDPRWPWRAAAELNATVRGVPQYWRALTKQNAGIFGELRTGQR
jgi:2,4-dienoyl-CoA reductase-like NADH-dependent reductase (Old Yellow Enzyme family)